MTFLIIYSVVITLILIFIVLLCIHYFRSKYSLIRDNEELMQQLSEEQHACNEEHNKYLQKEDECSKLSRIIENNSVFIETVPCNIKTYVVTKLVDKDEIEIPEYKQIIYKEACNDLANKIFEDNLCIVRSSYDASTSNLTLQFKIKIAE
jgi:hypothetical protein